ncbi:transcriptional regulator [Flammeovirgaceae bacterium 311]|nr:transcriptional regulator [Flammeovirgaceae bacterium 311]
MSVVIQKFSPSPALKPYIEHYWQGDFNTSAASLLVQQIVPDGFIDLIIHLTDTRCELLQHYYFDSTPDYMIVGLYTRSFPIQFTGLAKVFSIRFKPEGIYQLFGVPAAELQETFIDIESLNRKYFRDFCHRLREKTCTGEMIHHCEQFFLQQLHNMKLQHYYLNCAAEIIRQQKGKVSMEALAAEACISIRQLEREFKQKIGLSPKQYMRLTRLSEANRLMDSGKDIDLTGLSYACGFADQAHFTREFREFIGEKPTAFLKEREKFFP